MRMRDGSQTKDPRLGRLAEFDERSRRFPIRGLVPQTLRGRSWPCRPTLDQGSESSCVGFAWTHELAAQPVVVPGADYAFAYGLYTQAQKLDEFEGEGYLGTSVLGGAKAVLSRGFVKEYRWAFSIDDVLQALSHAGPVVIGSDWLEQMFTPDDNGLLTVTGLAVGGHCYLARGLLLKPSFADEPVVRCRNSWSRQWGAGGDFFLRVSDLEKLLKLEGEACLPMYRSRG